MKHLNTAMILTVLSFTCVGVHGQEVALPLTPPAESGPRITVASYYFGNFGYPFTNTIGGNTQARFKEALVLTKQRLLANPNGPRILNINCCNEWTEGSYLDPDVINGMQYLEAVREVFGSGEVPPAAPAAEPPAAAPSNSL